MAIYSVCINTGQVSQVNVNPFTQTQLAIYIKEIVHEK